MSGRGVIMARSRVSKHRVKEIADLRMRRLAELAVLQVREGNQERARRYVHIARRIGMKTRTPMPEGFRYCKGCQQPLVPGLNSRVRLKNGRILIHCMVCDRCIRVRY
ncbi:MAG: ribonuclease P protein component 4 [Candidatus Methanomethylophilaceae archaeon]|nr:ribonuclease P protein component 4 [Candidatus Methanomethylophilaceae archaeon]